MFHNESTACAHFSSPLPNLYISAPLQSWYLETHMPIWLCAPFWQTDAFDFLPITDIFQLLLLVCKWLFSYFIENIDIFACYKDFRLALRKYKKAKSSDLVFSLTPSFSMCRDLLLYSIFSRFISLKCYNHMGVNIPSRMRLMTSSFYARQGVLFFLLQ